MWAPPPFDLRLLGHSTASYTPRLHCTVACFTSLTGRRDMGKRRSQDHDLGYFNQQT